MEEMRYMLVNSLSSRRKRVITEITRDTISSISWRIEWTSF